MTTDASCAGWKRSQIYLRGYADAKGMVETNLALHNIERFHQGQFRNGGLPFASHGIAVGGHLVSLGFDDDCLVAAGICHDVFEDTKFYYSDLLRLGFSDTTLNYVDCMTKKEGQTVDEYFGEFTECPMAGIIKVVDRFHNMTTMTMTFKPERARRFIDETREYVFPLLHMLKKALPMYTQQIYQLKYSLEGLVETVEVFYPE